MQTEVKDYEPGTVVEIAMGDVRIERHGQMGTVVRKAGKITKQIGDHTFEANYEPIIVSEATPVYRVIGGVA